MPLTAIKNQQPDFIKFLKISSDPIVLHKIDGEILFYNGAFEKLCNYSTERLEQLNFYDILPPKVGAPNPELVVEKIAQDDAYEFYGVLNKGDGSLEDVYLSCTSHLINSEQHLISVIKRPFRQVGKENGIKFLNRFPEENPNPVLQVNAAMRILYANHSSSDLLEKLQVEVGDLLPNTWQDHIRRLQDDELDVSSFEYTIENRVYQFEHSIVEATDLIFIHGLDITNIKQTQNKLEQLNSEMNNFLYRAHHDLKSPVSTLKGLLNLSLNKNKDVELMQFLKLMESTTNKMDNILSDLVKVIKLNDMETEVGKMDASTLLSTFTEDLEIGPFLNSPELNISVENDLETKTDVRAISFIIRTLLSNAIKFRNNEVKNHRVGLYLNFSGSEITVEVKDNGMGINEDIRPHIFDMFYRGTNEVKGNGMGLYIARKSADLIRGKIEVESKENIGSTFRFTAPAIT